MAENSTERVSRKEALTNFALKSKPNYIPQTPSALKDSYGMNIRKAGIREYDRKTVEEIIDYGNLERKIALSRWFFNQGGIYQRIIIHYATLLHYSGLIIPYPSFGKSLSKGKVGKKYYNANLYIERMNTKSLFDKISTAVLIDGAYFGLIINMDKNDFSYMDLPIHYCRSRFKTSKGVSIIEFDVKFFDKIIDVEKRKALLRIFPAEVVRVYNKYKNGKKLINDSTYVPLPTECTMCFKMFDNFDISLPPFLEVIPSIFDYEDTVENEKKRDKEEIKKVIAQKIPHLSDGALLFEPDEAEEIHKATVGMMSKNENVDILTTYADVEAITSTFSNEGVNKKIENAMRNVYQLSGASAELFCSTSNLTLETSIRNDILFMMVLANKYAIFLTDVINTVFGSTSLTFKYKMLPISLHNQKTYLEDAFKLASSGYSLLLPAAAMGMSQLELVNLKDLENNYLELNEVLQPLQSSYTQTKENESGADAKSRGGQKKDPSEMSEKTEANQKALDKGGSDGNGNE